jgi:hypothetical protein
LKQVKIVCALNFWGKNSINRGKQKKRNKMVKRKNKQFGKGVGSLLVGEVINQAIEAGLKARTQPSRYRGTSKNLKATRTIIKKKKKKPIKRKVTYVFRSSGIPKLGWGKKKQRRRKK